MTATFISKEGMQFLTSIYVSAAHPSAKVTEELQWDVHSGMSTVGCTLMVTAHNDIIFVKNFQKFIQPPSIIIIQNGYSSLSRATSVCHVN